MTRKEFFQAVSEVMKEIGIDYKHTFMTPWGSKDTPYDVTAFKGWNKLADKLKLECEHPFEKIKLSSPNPFMRVSGQIDPGDGANAFYCECGAKLRPIAFEEILTK